MLSSRSTCISSAMPVTPLSTAKFYAPRTPLENCRRGMQEPRSEAVVAAKVAGMSVDTRVRGPVRTSPTEAKKTSGAPAPNNHNSSTAGAAGKRDHRRQRREDRKAL
eukprot:PhM_4_TR15966/c2_g1_i2/m.45709